MKAQKDSNWNFFSGSVAPATKFFSLNKFMDKFFSKFHKSSYLHEVYGISWNEWKTRTFVLRFRFIIFKVDLVIIDQKFVTRGSRLYILWGNESYKLWRVSLTIHIPRLKNVFKWFTKHLQNQSFTSWELILKKKVLFNL